MSSVAESARALLTGCHVTALPVDPAALSDQLHIPRVTYTEYKKIAGEHARLPGRSKDGLSLLLSGQPVIVYDHCLPPPRLRWTIAHELGHICLGHLSEAGIAPAGSPYYETQANRFARALLCPMEVMQLCCVSTARELSVLTGLSAAAAEHCFAQLMLLRKQNQLFSTPQSRSFVLPFLPFISGYLSKAKGRQGDSAVSLAVPD